VAPRPGGDFVAPGNYDFSSIHDMVEYYRDGSWHDGPSYPVKIDGSLAVAISNYKFLNCAGYNANIRA
jgi:hypothetical protein